MFRGITQPRHTAPTIGSVLALLPLLALLLNGCASSLPKSGAITDSAVNQTLSADPPEGLAMIYVIRSSQMAGSAVNATVYLDGQSDQNKVGSVRPGQYVYFPSRPDELAVLVSMRFNPGTDLILSPEEGGTLFLYLEMAFFGPKLTQIEPAVAQDLLLDRRITQGALKDQDRLAERQRNHPAMLRTALAAYADSESPDTQAELGALVINDNSGEVLSPYTSDGVTAEWVNQTINASMGSAVGSAVGAEVGRQMAGSVPLVGSFLGSRAGASVGRQLAVDMALVRSSSDQSFRNLNDMARYLVHHFGHNTNFSEVVRATDAVFPGFQQAVQLVVAQAAHR